MGSCCTKQRDEHSNDVETDHEYAGGNVQVITARVQWDQKIAEATETGKIVVANFSAVWCGPCQRIAPEYIELSEQYRSLVFLTVDVDELADLTDDWGISATPTFFFLKEGKQLYKLVGANEEELKSKLAGLYM